MAARTIAAALLMASVMVLSVAGSPDNMPEVPGTVVYERSAGNVTVDSFDEVPFRMNLIPVTGAFNPSLRLPSCEHLGAGRFPIYGNCSQYLECIPEGSSYTRRVLECPVGLWFRTDFNHSWSGCGLRNNEECPLGVLVSSPILSSRTVPGGQSGVTCTQAGKFATPGCRGYYTCFPSWFGTGWDTYFYMCPESMRWSGDVDFCVPQEQVQCSVAEDGLECLRECVPGDTRTCSFTFIVEEFASMSFHCKNCPFTPEDCNLPGCIASGGVSKPLIAINRQVPGPTVQACKGDTLEIEVQNRMGANAVTIHWHGLHQRATPHMDGVPYLTQCPVHPGNTFRYRMLADVSGTHLYHSHVGHQESDGMFGAMIIREPRADEFGIAARYDEDLPEHRILAWHWFPRAAETESLDTRLQSLRREGFGLTINGKGLVTKIFGKDGNPAPTPYETYRVQFGKRYRFRAIFNSALNCPIQLSIDGHQLDVLATDGRPIRSAGYVDSIFLSAGERVDFVPHATWRVRPANQSFFIRIRGLMDCDDNKNGVFQHAYLRYDGSSGAPESTTSNYANSIRSGVGFNLNRDLFNMNNYYIQSRSLHTAIDANPSPDPRIAGVPNKTFYINARFNAYTVTENTRSIHPQLNGITYNAPSFPPLTQSESITSSTFCRDNNLRNCQNGLCRCSHNLHIDTGDLVELVMVDTAATAGIGHPFHLHGFAYRVVAMHASDHPITVDEVRANNTQGLINKQFDGPLKDTLIVPARGYAVMRFVASNPGFWLFHCHISEHMGQGMALSFQVGHPSEMVKPPANFPRCGNFF